ncbi:uncharacterized protein [Elaeis guineensis]|uniref:uncharacterized protein isoform X3 n=1 Tax=Elaeis guineensis var. tenera TaxID=51953 RepID=UPI003C6D161A
MWASSVLRFSAPPLIGTPRSRFLVPSLALSLVRSPSAPSKVTRISVRCSYVASNIMEDSSSVPIDVAADVKTEKMAV